ncbi:MAG: hypothetical protein COB40_06080 [Marinosulfonomonas sp.]|nr:MAG: hypothetical protein COB40_06080 [Marinosulfonomonas sp.]
MDSLWVFAALGTATCFALTSLLAYDAVRALGVVAFSFVRMAIAAIGFAAYTLITGFDTTMQVSDIGLLVISGVLGVFLADTFRYSALARIGPQLQTLLNTATAPFALLLGFLILGQVVSGLSLLGTGVVLAGILLAIVSRNASALSRFSGDKGGLVTGVLFGVAAALMQAGSVLIAAPVMLQGTDPISATAVRSAAGAVSLLLPTLMSRKNRDKIRNMNISVARQVLLVAVIGPGLGMTLQLYALATGPVGIVSTLSTTTPLIILPLVWVIGRSRPGLFSWLGALTGILGVWLIVSQG